MFDQKFVLSVLDASKKINDDLLDMVEDAAKKLAANSPYMTETYFGAILVALQEIDAETFRQLDMDCNPRTVESREVFRQAIRKALK